MIWRNNMGTLPNDMIKDILKKQKMSQGIEEDENDVEVGIDELESFGSKESLKTMFSNVANYNSMLKERITFINDDLTKAIPFTRENLYLLCAYSGSGKSTVAANVSYPLWKQGKKSLVISNEESEQDILFRIACLDLGYNFNSYKKGTMPASLQKQCLMLFPEIAKYVKIADVNYKNGLTTKVEGVKNLLEAVNGKGYSCAMIDYYQLIKKTITNPGADTYNVLNDFRIWLGQYIKRADLPIVVFAQLHSLGKRNNKDLDSRIKHCPDVYEPATVVVEIIPDFENQTSSFLLMKDRFGLAGNRIECAFDKGRFIPMTAQVIQDREDKKLVDMEEKADENA